MLYPYDVKKCTFPAIFNINYKLSSTNFDGKSTKSSNAVPSKRRISWSPTPGEGEEEGK